MTGFCLRREAARRHGLRYEEDLAHGEILSGPIAAASVGRIALVRAAIATGLAPDRPATSSPWSRLTAGSPTPSSPSGCPSCARSGRRRSTGIIWCRWSGRSPRCPPSGATGSPPLPPAP
ncbi:hypothetical protein SBADM41S_10825 [Streptomyces badius]